MEKAVLYRIDKGWGKFGYYRSRLSYERFLAEYIDFYETQCKAYRAKDIDIRTLHKPTGAKLAIHDGEMVWEEL